MTATPGSAAPTASEPPLRPAAPARVHRFGASERLAHWIHAVAFLGLLASGLVLFLPALASSVGNRPLAKAVHLAIAVAWVTGLALVAVLGDRRALRQTRRQLERFDDDDLRWLRGRPAPQGRFNAGQKAHAVLQAALATLFLITGALLWLGERNTALRLPGTIAMHDLCMFFAVILVLGHLHFALIHEATKPALSGMVRGDVDAAWAARHHAKWRPRPAAAAPRPSAVRAGAAAAIALAGVIAAAALVIDVL